MAAQNFGKMRSLLNMLDDIDNIIHYGNREDDLGLARIDILKSLEDLDKIQSMDTAQKSKIK